MSFQTSEPILPDDSNITAARRRRKRRMLLAGGDEKQAEYLEEFARQTTPSAEFFAFSLLAGLLLALALYTGQRALFLLAVVVVPFMAPLVGLSLSTVVGSARFLALNLGGLLLGALSMFFGSLLGGWIFSFAGEVQLDAAFLPLEFSTIDLLVLTIGAGLATYRLARSPNHHPALMGALLTYEIFLPLGAAGFGLSAKVSGMAATGFTMFYAHMAWAVLIGVVVLVAHGLKPSGTFTFAVGAVLALMSLPVFLNRPAPDTEGVKATTEASLVSMTPAVEDGTPSGSKASGTPEATATLTATPRPSATPTITPTHTFTATPTSVYALVAAKEGFGVIIRAEADPDSVMVATPMNDTLVEVFEEKTVGGKIWAHVRLIQNGEEVVGWIMRDLIATATPGGVIQ